MRQKGDANEGDAQKEADALLLAHYVPASVVVDASMEVQHFRGDTRLYLAPAPGKASFNLFKMAHAGLMLPLRTAIQQARTSGQRVKKKGIELLTRGTIRQVTLEVLPLKDDSFLVLFAEASIPSLQADAPPLASTRKTETGTPDAKDRQIASLQQVLAGTREEMRSVVAELEAANKELQSANEEVLSSNEELQSLNEELETSKEEIEATNEELHRLNEELETSKKEIQVSNDQLLVVNQKLQQSNAQLQAARAYTENIVQTLREPLLVLDADLSVQSTNPAFCQFFQVEPAQIEHHLLFELGNRQWDIPALRTLLEQVLPERQSFQDFEVDHVFPPIEHRTLLLNARRIPGTESRESLILLVFEDITERRELEWHKDAFLAIASHELKTPVTSLNAYAKLLHRHYAKAGDEHAAQMLATMEGQANELTSLIGQLLDTSQLHTRTSLLHPRRFDVTALTHSVIEEVQRTTQTHQISLEWTIHKPFLGDAERISQVLTNLLSNAIKYSPTSEQILVRLQEDAATFILSVQDFGIGIPADKHAYLFERFYRMNTSAQMAIPGLGLGLYISSEIVKQHGGHLWVESREGEGSTFFARFVPVL